MFAKRKCETTPVFKAPVQAETSEREHALVAALTCPSGAELKSISLRPPSAAALMEASKLPEARWLHAHRLECGRCKKVCSVTVNRPATGEAPNALAVRSRARPDFYALQHAFLPEWFLNKPEEAMSLLSNKLDGWQTQTMRQLREVVDCSPGDPMPIRAVQVVGTPGETSSLLIDFMTPCAPIEAHHALLVGGPTPRYFMSEKTHLGDENPLEDLAGLTEWSFGAAGKSEMKHTAIELLPEVSRAAFFNAAVEHLKKRFA